MPDNSFYDRYPSWKAQADKIDEAIEKLCACHYAGGKILTCGNGGSAADSIHMVGELAKGFNLRRPLGRETKKKFADALGDAGALLAEDLQEGINAVSLAESPALLTAIVNDTAGEMIFAQQVYATGQKDDILVAFSTSGNSENIVRAVQVASVLGIFTIGLTGKKESRMDQYCDIVFKADATETYLVQELHYPLYHKLCAEMEAKLFG